MTDVPAGGVGAGPRILRNADGTYYGEVAGAVGSVFRMNAGGPAAGQSNKAYTGNVNIAAGATVALETVAAGKTLYITDISITTNTAVVILVQIQAAGVTIWQAYMKGDTAPISLPGLETQPSASGGQAVTLVFAAAAATQAAFFVSGIEG